MINLFRFIEGGAGRRDSRGKPPARKIITAAPAPPVVVWYLVAFKEITDLSPLRSIYIDPVKIIRVDNYLVPRHYLLQRQ